MSAESPADNPYAPPVAANGPKEAADNPPPSNNALVFLLIALAVFVVSAGLVLLLRAPLPGFLGFAIAALVAVCGFGIALVSFARVAFSPAPAPSGSVLRAIAGLLGNGAMALVGAAAALFVLMAFSRGRQLRRFGRILQPPLHKSADWARLAIGSEAGNQDCPTRRALAAQWRENGRTEHASVAAFARLTLDLMALGAPPELVAAANRDALDEIRHTELCFSLARSLDGESESPGPFPQASRARTLPRSRTLALSALAVDSLIDGALHEGVSARVIAKLARRCEDDPTRAILNGIAADEGRHAAHGWDVVEWCLAEGGAPVESALVGALRVLPHTIHTELPAAAADGSWERHGIHGHALESEAFSATREGLVGRLQRMMTKETPAAA